MLALTKICSFIKTVFKNISLLLQHLPFYFHILKMFKFFFFLTLTFMHNDNDSQIYYSDPYESDDYFFRHVFLPKSMLKHIPEKKLLTESEWRSIGIKQSEGWEHFMIHGPEPHILLFRKPKKPNISIDEVMRLFRVLFRDAGTRKEECSQDSKSSINLPFNGHDNILKEEKVVHIEEKASKYWDLDVLPITYYLKQIEIGHKKRYYMHKAEKSENICVFEISPRKLASILTQLDIMLIKNIKPKELVEYDGTEEKDRFVPSIDNLNISSNIKIVKMKHANITFLKNKNRGLVNYISFLLKTEKGQRYFLKVMKYLKEMNNYNSLDCISKSFQTQKLSTRNLERLIKVNKDIETYFDIRNVIERLYEKKTIFIYPFDIFLKDVEDSNRFRNNEDASMRFCRLMEMLIGLQNNYKYGDIKHKYEHFFFYNFYKFIDYRVKDTRAKENVGNFLFLFL